MPDAPNKGSNTRSKPAGLGNQVAELDRMGLVPTADDPLLLPTPVVNDMGAGKTPEQWDQWTDDLKARGYGNGNGHGNSLSVEVIRAEGEALLPTPQTRDATGGKPEAVHRGRGYGADLNDVAAAGLLDLVQNGLLETGGELPLLRTPQAQVTEPKPGIKLEGRSPSDPQVGLVDQVIADFHGDLLPTPMARDHRTGSPAETERNSPGLSSIDALLPTPAAWDTGGGRQHTTRPTNNGKVLSEAVRELPLLPTPSCGDANGGGKRNNTSLDSTQATDGSGKRGARYLKEVAQLLDAGDALLPTPTAGDGMGGASRTVPDGEGGRRPVSWEDTTTSTGEGGASRLRDVVNLFNPDAPLLPTPRRSDSKGTDSPGERTRHTPGLGAIGVYYDTDLDAGDELMPTPMARDGKGLPSSSFSNASLVRAIDDLAKGGDDEPAVVVTDDGDEQYALFPPTEAEPALLPTPSTHDRTGPRSPESIARMGKPFSNLNDVVVNEIDGALLPTPVTTDAMGARNSTAWRSDPESKIKIGDTLTDAMWKLAAERGEMELPAGPMRGKDVAENDGSLLPTPRASRGASTTETTYALGGARSDENRTQGEVLLPTPTVGARWVRNSPGEMARVNPALGAVIADLAENGQGSRFYSTPPTAGGQDTKEEVLLPTPKSHQRRDCPSERDRRSPDLQATTHHFPNGRWGKYGAAVARWESFTRPAPAPTEPNKNGNPRLTARFSEWLLGWPEGWVTDPEIGISRSGQLRLIGNGVVPQQAAAALAILFGMLDDGGPDAEPETRHVP